MKKHEIAYVGEASIKSLNTEIKKREENGWTLVPPILARERRFDNYGNMIAHEGFILTFEKED